jgi:arsenite methyltransferase
MELQFAGRTIELLEHLYAAPALIEYRKSLLQKLQLIDHASLLDLGIGTSANTLLVLEQFPNIKVIGIDYSLPMLRHSRQKLIARDLSKQVNLLCIDAHKINFPGGTFDYAIISQVLSYVRDPVLVLENVKNCMKTGGRILVEDSDWESFIYNCGGDPVWQKVRSAWLEQSFRVDGGRRLKEFARHAGLQIENSSHIHLQDNRFNEDQYGYWLAMIIADHLQKDQVMREPELSRWLSILQNLSNLDGYYFGLNRMSVIATV